MCSCLPSFLQSLTFKGISVWFGARSSPHHCRHTGSVDSVRRDDAFVSLPVAFAFCFLTPRPCAVQRSQRNLWCLEIMTKKMVLTYENKIMNRQGRSPCWLRQIGRMPFWLLELTDVSAEGYGVGVRTEQRQRQRDGLIHTVKCTNAATKSLSSAFPLKHTQPRCLALSQTSVDFGKPCSSSCCQCKKACGRTEG